MQKDTKTIGFIAVILVLVFVIAFLLAQKGGISLAGTGTEPQQSQQCNEVKNGSIVLAYYTVGVATQQGINVLDTNVEEEAVKSRIYNPFVNYAPANLTVGTDVIAGVSEALAGMKKGEEKRFVVPPEKGYGDIDPQKREIVENSDLAKLGVQNIAANMQIATEKGNARIASFNETHALLDYNPILAGQTLIYKAKVVDIIKC